MYLYIICAGVKCRFTRSVFLPDQVKKVYYDRTANQGLDFGEARVKLLDLLQPLALAVSKAHHTQNLRLVRRAAGLMSSIDWESSEKNTVVLQAQGASHKLCALPCERLLAGAEARFTYWEASFRSMYCFVPSSPLVVMAVSFLRDRDGTFLRLFECGLPMTSAELEKLCDCSGVYDLRPIRPARWKSKLRAHASSLRFLAGATFSFTSNPGDYLLYGNECFYLAALGETEEEKRWTLLRRKDLKVLQVLEPAKRGLPPCSENCRSSPDERIKEVISLLQSVPERVELNALTRPHPAICGRGESLLQTGVAFTVGNLAAVTKKDAAGILRTPIWGPRFGVRARISEPLGGREVSVSCLNSVSDSDAAVLDSEARASRLGTAKQKEVTAQENKLATRKMDQAIVAKDGAIRGPLLIDYICRRKAASLKDSAQVCLGRICPRTGRCLQCHFSYAAAENQELDSKLLLHRKLLMPSAEQLTVSKKLRRFKFESSDYFLLRGSQTESLKQFYEYKKKKSSRGAVASVSVVPPGFELGTNVEKSALFFHQRVFVLAPSGLLELFQNGVRVPGSRSLSASDKRRVGILLKNMLKKIKKIKKIQEKIFKTK